MALLAVIAADADVHALQRQPLVPGVQRHGQGLAGAQCGIEQVVGLGCRARAAKLDRDIAVQGVRADADALKQTSFIADADHGDGVSQG
ncbi:hypothetical protein D3C72_1780980 [compost metagenome]